MSDLPRDPADGGADDPLDPIEPQEVELDEDGNPVEPEPELDEDGNPIEPDPEPEPEPRQTRRTGPRGRANGEEIRELRSQLEQTNRQLTELQRRPAAAPFDPQAAQAAENKFWADLDLMAPAEAMKAVYARARGEFQQQFVSQSISTQETLDKQSYDASARISRVHQQYRQRVEDLVATERARGNTVPRDVALKFLLGEDAINRANRVVPGQRRAAGARVAAQTTRPVRGGGDVARGGRRRDEGADDEALLRNITAGDI